MVLYACKYVMCSYCSKPKPNTSKKNPAITAQKRMHYEDCTSSQAKYRLTFVAKNHTINNGGQTACIIARSYLSEFEAKSCPLNMH